jgi:hypothetical protein
MAQRLHITNIFTNTKNIFYSTIRGLGWLISPLFPASNKGKPENNELIFKMIGHEFSVFMPIQRGDNTMNYHWKFRIKGVAPE